MCNRTIQITQISQIGGIAIRISTPFIVFTAKIAAFFLKNEAKVEVPKPPEASQSPKLLKVINNHGIKYGYSLQFRNIVVVCPKTTYFF